ncbi:MAG: efflux RND transporter periplasmic adaptor subunit [Brevinematales bacterium]|nr:efflux RND transporter periplasmic adaptor subunit [Brevinematales bacterium]
MKRWLFLVLSLLFLGGGMVWWFGKKTSSPLYGISTIERGTISQSISATGNLEYSLKHYVYAKVTGIVNRVYVSSGEKVKTGALLATIDDSDLRLTYEKKKQNLVQVSNTLISAKQTYDYTRNLYEKQFAASSELENARLNYENALATYHISLLEVKEAQQQLAYCKLTSPVDGIIAINNLKTGTNLTMAPFLAFVIASRPTVMQIQALVSEGDISLVKKGQSVRFTVSAFQDTFQGWVEDIWYQPQTSQDVVYYPVLIRVDNSSQKLLPGMSASLEIVVAEKKNVLRVPSRALRLQPNSQMLATLTNQKKEGDFTFSPTNRQRKREPLTSPQRQENTSLLWLINTNTGEILPVRVKTGLSDGQYTEILPLQEKDNLEGKTIIVSLSPTKKTSSSQISSPSSQKITTPQTGTVPRGGEIPGGMPGGGNTPPPMF